MRKGITIALALLATACASGGGGGGGEALVDFDAQLAPTSGYQIRGTANAVAAIGRTAVSVEIENGTPGATYPWHVHQGKCGSNGPVVGKGTDYPPIKVGENGKERVVATVTTQLADDTDYFVNIHLSAQQMNVIVACGALVD